MTTTSAPSALRVAPLLDLIAGQAAAADANRSIAPEVIAALRDNDVMRASASHSLGGIEAPASSIGRELEAVAAACGSTAWCLWNHLCVFHLYCGMLGPAHHELLAGITAAREWVSFPAGAGTSIRGRRDGASVSISGQAAFGSGARYGNWVGVVFMLDDAPHFTIVRTDALGVSIDATWRAMSLRASATDHVNYADVRVPIERVVPFTPMYRVRFREPDFDVIHPRYREDWVAFSDLWLAAMAVGVVQAALDECCAGIQERRAIMGTKMVERATIHVNIGQAGALLNAARACVYDACAATDDRIADATTPTETSYLEQCAAGMAALRLCDEALRGVLRVLGGNGLREGPAFERRYRDFQAMPLHINAHPDRVGEQYGRHLLGLDTTNTF